MTVSAAGTRRISSPPRSPAAGLLLTLTFILFSGCGRQAAGPLELEAATPPPDLAQLDAAVREHFDEVWSALHGPGAAQLAAAERGTAWGMLGHWFHLYAYPDSASACYRNARRLAPAEPRWPYYLGTLAAAGGDLESAESSYRAARELAPDEISPRLRLAQLALQRYRLETADALFGEVLATDPENPGALLGRARLALERGDPAAATPILERLAAAQPTAGEVRYALAVARRQLGDTERAEAELAELPDTEIDQGGQGFESPWDSELRRLDRGARNLTRLGRRAFRSGNLTQAAILLGGAVAAEPEGAEKRINYGIALRELGHHRAAEEQLRAALARAEAGSELAARAHLELGRLYAASRLPARAASELDAALAIDPTSAAGHLERALVDLRRGNLAGALPHLALLRELPQPLPAGRFWHAAVLVRLGRVAAAMAAIEADLARIGHDRPLELLLARMLATAPEPGASALSRARELLDRWASAPDVLFAETAAMVTAAAGDAARATDWQAAAVAAAADHPPRTAAQIARRRLELYRRGATCRRPWEDPETLVLRPVAAPTSRDTD